jgi:HEAT repeat protein
MLLVAALALPSCRAAAPVPSSPAGAPPVTSSPWLPTSAFGLSPTAAGLVDALADFPFQWAPGEYVSEPNPFDKLEALLTPSQATALLRHQSGTVRAYMALHAARRLGAYDALGPVLRDPTVIEDQTTDDIVNSTVAHETMQAVCDRATTDPRARGLVERVLADVAFRPAWGGAVRCAGMHHMPGAREQALALIDDPDPALQWDVFAALEETATDADAPRLLGLLEDRDSVRRFLTVKVLDRLRGPGVLEALERLAHTDGDHEVRGAAAGAYARHEEGKREVIESLIASADEDVSEGTACGLARRGGPDDLALMVPYLRRTERLHGLETIEVFARPPRKEWLVAMRELTVARADDIRERALTWLGRAGDRAALPLARRALRSRDVLDRLGGISAVAALNDKDSVPALVLLLDDANPNIRLASARALTVLHAKRAYDKLVKAAERESSEHEGMLEACAALRDGRELAVDEP